jgi:hypothetical protein
LHARPATVRAHAWTVPAARGRLLRRCHTARALALNTSGARRPSTTCRSWRSPRPPLPQLRPARCGVLGAQPPVQALVLHASQRQRCPQRSGNARGSRSVAGHRRWMRAIQALDLAGSPLGQFW